MPLVVSQNEAEVSNGGTIEGAPGVRITGEEVVFTNQAGGLVRSIAAGAAAIVLEGIAAEIVNLEGGEIRAFAADETAILGSSNDDEVVNSGLVFGGISLGDGADAYEHMTGASVSFVDLGAGDDAYEHAADGPLATVEGGAGTDIVELVTASGPLDGSSVTGFEHLEIEFALGVEWHLTGFSGYQVVLVGEGGGSYTFMNSLNPAADILLEGGSFVVGDGSAFASIAGSDDTGEFVAIDGGTVIGNIGLGDGEDTLRLSQLTSYSGTSTIGGLADGGAGLDTIRLLADLGQAFDLQDITGFEFLDIEAGGDVRVVGADGYLRIGIGAGSTLALGDSVSPGAVVVFDGAARLTLEATAAVMEIGVSIGEIAGTADPALSLDVTVMGTVLGDVHLGLGNDTLNASLGTLGGSVFGYAGDDTLTGAAAANSLFGGSGADTLIGGAASDRLEGEAGNDRLDGGAGIDTMVGGAGNDTYVTDVAGDIFSEAAGEGTDTVEAAYTYTLGANIENLTLTGTASIHGTGTATANVIRGNSATNQLNGLAGNDLLDGGTGNDLMYGGDGDDTYVVDNVSDKAIETSASGGNDLVLASVGFTLGANVERLTLTGTAAATGRGNELANTIIGNNANNLLEGKGGADIMRGFLGNDTYEVDQAGDVVDETGGGGIDTVQSAISYTLGTGLENLTLTGTAMNGTGNALNNVIVGNALANSLTGLDGNDRLDGGGGADTMTGGTGNDTYVVDNAGDVTTEAAGAGHDTVLSSVTWTLGANFETLTLTATGHIDGTGNSVTNTLNGNAGNNLLDGGGGIDLMFGGLGNDTYVVDTIGDKATEVYANGGTDLVLSSVSFQLNTYVENLTLTGAASIIGRGNNAANLIIGNSGNNVLDGRGGADTLQGGLGNDTYVVDDAGDSVTELAGEGNDTVESSVAYTLGADVENLVLTGAAAVAGTGNALNNVITGNAAANSLNGGDGDDRLTGGGGADTLTGGAGNDTYVIDALDTLAEAAGGGTDTVQAGFSYTLLDNFEILTLTGTGNINGTGNTAANTLNGNAGANTLDGGLGLDTMFGGAGDDTYIVDNSLDRAVEVYADGGIDTVRSIVSFDLAANVENLVLTGVMSVNGSGNALDNVITGNAYNNVLTGWLGGDTLNGNGGNDTYRYTATTESTGDARDTIAGFNAGDRIDLSLIDANGAGGAGNGTFAFLGAGAFTGVAGQLRATQSSGLWTIEGDTNGDGVADLLIGLTTSDGHTLGATDFVL